jgi:hypothetical protein
MRGWRLRTGAASGRYAGTSFGTAVFKKKKEYKLWIPDSKFTSTISTFSKKEQ